jgi:hypothetical protein
MSKAERVSVKAQMKARKKLGRCAKKKLTSDGSRLTYIGLPTLPARLVQFNNVLHTLVFPLPSGPSSMTLGESSWTKFHSFSSHDCFSSNESEA